MLSFERDTSHAHWILAAAPFGGHPVSLPYAMYMQLCASCLEFCGCLTRGARLTAKNTQEVQMKVVGALRMQKKNGEKGLEEGREKSA